MILGLDVLLQHGRGGVAGDLHDVVKIHAGQVHQRGAGLLLADVQEGNLLLLNPGLLLARMLRIVCLAPPKMPLQIAIGAFAFQIGAILGFYIIAFFGVSA